MPGPLAKNRTTRQPAPNSPNKKTEARLIARTAAAPMGPGFTLPGSQNRKK